MKARLVALFTRHLQSPFVILLLLAMVAMLWLSREWSLGARMFPTVVAGAGILLALLELTRQARTRGAREARDFSDLGGDDAAAGFHARGLLFFGWLVVFIAAFLLVGALPAAGAFIVAFLRIQFREPWRLSLALALGVVAALWLLGHLLQLRWPTPLFLG